MISEKREHLHHFFSLFQEAKDPSLLQICLSANELSEILSQFIIRDIEGHGLVQKMEKWLLGFLGSEEKRNEMQARIEKRRYSLLKLQENRKKASRLV